MPKNRNKANPQRMTARRHANPYPSEGHSVVFVGITKNKRVVATARQNIMERINRHDSRPPNFNPWFNVADGLPIQPSNVSNGDVDLTKQHPSNVTIGTSDFADEEGESSYSSTESEGGDRACVMYEYLDTKQPGANEISETQALPIPSLDEPIVSNNDVNLTEPQHSAVEAFGSSDFTDDEDGISYTSTEGSDTESEDDDENSGSSTDVSGNFEQPETNEKSKEEEPIPVKNNKESEE